VKAKGPSGWSGCDTRHTARVEAVRPAASCCPIQGLCLPIGSVTCGRAPSGADTEVRPPATLCWGPCGRVSLDECPAEVIGRSMVFGCPSGRGSADESPAERTQRSAPPPPCVWALAGGCLGLSAQRRLLVDPWSLSAHRVGDLRTRVQRSGYRDPRGCGTGLSACSSKKRGSTARRTVAWTELCNQKAGRFAASHEPD
jgi:hypothetical protein